MSKTKRHVFTDDFKKEAVRLNATSGRTLPQVAEDLGVGLSSLCAGNSSLMKLIFYPVHMRM